MSTLERISAWVWEASWQAALIAVVGFVAQRLLRHAVVSRMAACTVVSCGGETFDARAAAESG